MLKSICGIRLDNQKVLRAPGPKIKYFERFFSHLINYLKFMKKLLNKLFFKLNSFIFYFKIYW